MLAKYVLPLLIIRCVSKEQRINDYIFGLHHRDQLWHEASITSESRLTGYIYQMYPAYCYDKIINLPRHVDSQVRQHFEVI